MDEKLKALLESARRRAPMSPAELEAQRVSFAFGNAPDGDSGSIESVRAASTIIKDGSAKK